MDVELIRIGPWIVVRHIFLQYSCTLTGIIV